MNRALMILMAFTPCCLLVCGAIYLAAQNVDGWGWFLFVAALLGGSVKFTTGGGE